MMAIFSNVLVASHSTVWLSTVSAALIISFVKTLISGLLVFLLISLYARKPFDPSLTQNARLFAAFMDNLPGYAWIKDLEGRYVYVNKAVIERLPPFASNWLGKTDAELWPREVGATYRANDLKVIAGKETVETVETVLLDGRPRYLLVSKFPILDHTGEVTMVGGISADITAQKRAEEALFKAEKKYRDIFENAGEGIFQSTPDGRYIAANPALARMYGFSSPEEFIHSRTDISRETYADPRRREEFKRLLEAHGMVRGFELQGLHKDGSRIWITVNARAVRDPHGKVLYYEGTGQDITDRKLAEEELSRLAAIVESSDDAIIGKTLEGVITSWNQGAEHIYGYTREEVIGRPMSILIPGDCPDDLVTILEKIRRGEPVKHYETTRVRKDGEIINVSLTVSPIKNADGVLIGASAIARNITERKGAEEALRESEERYRELFENAKDATYVHDLSGRYTSVNRAAEKLSGHSRNEIIGRSFIDFVPPEQIQIVSEHLHQKLIKEGETSYETEVISRDGRRIPVEVNSHLIYENGAGISVQGTARDITERKRAEQALRQSEERFSKAFHSSPAALSISLLEDGRLLEVNAAFLRMTGFDRKEVIGRSTVELGLWAKELRQVMTAALSERGAVANLEIIFQKKSGEMRDGLLSAELIQLGTAGPSVLGIVQDVTERNRAEKALQGFPRQLIEAQEAERQSIARELHDQIGQVLTAIHLNLEAVRKSCGNSEARVLVDEGVGIVDELLEQVRDLSFELRPSLLDDLGLPAALRWYTDRFARRTGIHAVIAIDLLENPTRLSRELETACFRIVQEALTNVVRHARAGNVWIKLKSLNDQILLSIKDDGIGFEVDSQNHLHFTTHVGLRGMQERALAVGGRLGVRSSPSGGTLVRANFPGQRKKDEWHE